MNKTQRIRFGTYLGISVLGFVTAMIFNGLATVNGENYGTAWTASAADLVLTWDLGLVAVAVVVFMFTEAKRIGMKRVWPYVLLSCVTAMACSFPLFMAMREKHLASLPNSL